MSGILFDRTVEKATDQLADAIRKEFPPTSLDGRPCIPSNYAANIADVLTTVVAEVVQAYIDAGSERDATFEELGPAILDHINGWTEKEV